MVGPVGTRTIKVLPKNTKCIVGPFGAALKNAVPPRRKVTPRGNAQKWRQPFRSSTLSWKTTWRATFNQRHTAHQIWGRMQVEMPACDIGESTVRAYVRVRKAELDEQTDVFSGRSSLDDGSISIVTSPYGSLKGSSRAAQRQASRGSSKRADGGNARKL